LTQKKKILDKILSGTSDPNIQFNKLCSLLDEPGFSKRIKGDHYIFYKDGVDEIVNIQALKNGKAKAYQVKQIRNLILKYNMGEML